MVVVILMIYGEKLKSLREEDNVKQKKLAEILNISRSLYGRYETEHETIPIKHLIVLCNYFKVSMDYILGFTTLRKYNFNSGDIINKDIVAKRLKEFRKNQKITQVELANILKVNQSTIAEYERGTNIIATPFLYTICKKYKVSSDYLLGRIDNPKYWE